MESDPTRIEGIPLTRHWLIPKGKQPKVYVPHPVMSADDIRSRTQGVWDQFYSWRNVWARAHCVESLKSRVAFMLISKLYRQMYANTGIATDSARINRSASWARLIAKPLPEALRRQADAGAAGAARDLVGTARRGLAVARCVCRRSRQQREAAPLRPPDRIGGAAVRENRRAGRRARRAAARARSARLGRHGGAAALPRRRRPARSSTRFRSPSAAITRDVGFYEAPLADGARALLVDCPGPLRSRRPLRRRQRRLSRQRAPLRVPRARRARVRRRAAGAAPSIVHAHDWQAGLAPVYLRTLYAVASGARRHAERLHDPQPRVSGAVRAGLAAAARSRLGAVRDRSARVLGPHQLPQGRHQRRATSITTVSRALRRGDPDAGVRLRVRRHPARAARPIWSAS